MRVELRTLTAADRDDPSVGRFALVGGAIGLATLARAEAFMLVGLLAIPLAVWVPRVAGARPRLRAAYLTGRAVRRISWTAP